MQRHDSYHAVRLCSRSPWVVTVVRTHPTALAAARGASCGWCGNHIFSTLFPLGSSTGPGVNIVRKYMYVCILVSSAYSEPGGGAAIPDVFFSFLLILERPHRWLADDSDVDPQASIGRERTHYSGRYIVYFLFIR